MSTKLTPDIVPLSSQGISGAPLPNMRLPHPSTGLGDIGSALSGIADSLSFAQKADRARRLTKAETETEVKMTELFTSLLEAHEPDALRSTFDQGIAAIESDMMSSLGDDQTLLNEWRGKFNVVKAKSSFNVRQQYLKKVADQGTADTDQHLDTLADRLFFADPAESEDILSRGVAAIQRAEDAGIFSDTQSQARIQNWEERVIQVQVRKGINNNPTDMKAKLQDEEMFPYLSPERRLAFIDEAEAAERAGILEAEQAERKLDQETKERQHVYAQQVLGKIVKGEYTIADWQRDNRLRRLPFGEAKTFLGMIQSGSVQQSDPAVKLGIIDNMTQGVNQRQEILQAVKRQEISYPDAMTLLEKNSQKVGASGPLSSKEYSEAARLLSRVFGQGGDKWDTGRQERYALAADELMQAVLNDGEAVAIPTAREILTREIRRGVSRPLGYTGELTLAGLEEYKRQLVKQQEKSPMPDAKFDGIIRQIDMTTSKILRIQEIEQTIRTVEK